MTEEQKKEIWEELNRVVCLGGGKTSAYDIIDKFISQAVKEERERIISKLDYVYDETSHLSDYAYKRKMIRTLEELKTNPQ